MRAIVKTCAVDGGQRTDSGYDGGEAGAAVSAFRRRRIGYRASVYWQRVFATCMAFLAPHVLSCGTYRPPPLGPAAQSTYEAVAPSGAPDPGPVPASSPLYDSKPSPPQNKDRNETRVSQQVASLLEERGAEAVADGRLDQIAAWTAHRCEYGELPGARAIDGVSRRVGHVGAPPFIVFLRVRDFDKLKDSTLRDALLAEFAKFPNNLVVSRYGIGTAGTDSDLSIAVAVAAVEVVLEPLPKHVRKGVALHVAGSVADRFDGVQLSITGPTGRVRNFQKEGRQFAIDIVPDDRGVYRIELLGEGKSGPVVVANVPVYVDVGEVDVGEPAEIATSSGSASDSAKGEPPAEQGSTPVQVEERILQLLNEARAEARVGPLIADDALASVARAHSLDMADHGFFGHISPTTGGPGDRLQHAGLRLAYYGENIARAGSAQEAFASLMDSPAHRGSMLDAHFTHVGIGAVVRPQPNGDPFITVTLVLGLRTLRDS